MTKILAEPIPRETVASRPLYWNVLEHTVDGEIVSLYLWDKCRVTRPTTQRDWQDGYRWVKVVVSVSESGGLLLETAELVNPWPKGAK